ncbi:hypothetical protein FUA48_00170 [Flavobacterium alkalisoli]|uniref:Ig-like domain-containing protein n=1 Tax=Flavobacterium alkalisoli TaxID=2602769 RepID=A0A5B9FQQ8_9FLAO|nr:hypothetical protein [Flavobacterium alkalisoli]QEE48048.1 hypothetical protein FUA48_00170 [Flavobacterium alkalisoli]
MKSFILKITLLITMLLSTTYFYGQSVEFTIKFDTANCSYEVYATSDTTGDIFVAGGSQISIVLPEAVDDSSLSVTSASSLSWVDNSQVYAPLADTTSDFHSIATNGGLLSFVATEELLIFTFELPGSACCAPGVRLFENGSDPDSTASGMLGGDFNSYFGDAFTFDDYYNGNYDNTTSVDPPTGNATQDFCEIENPTVADLVTNEEDVVWYDAASGGTAYNSTDALTDGTTYYGALEPGICESSSRFAVTVTINDAATPTGDATQDFCLVDSPKVSDIVVSGGTITWYSAATGGSVVAGATALIDGTTYYASITDGVNGCESSVRLAVTVNVDDAATPTGNASQEFCAINNPKVSNLVANGGTIIWYDASTGGSVVAGTTDLVDGTTYYASITDGVSGCESSVRLAVTVTINDADTPTGDATQEFCAIDNPTVSDLNVNESNVTWYNAATGGSIVTAGTALTTATTYYGSLTDGVSGCSSATRFAVTVSIGDAPPPTGFAIQDFCEVDNPTIASLVTDETGVTWYNAATGGSAIATNTPLVNNTTYYGSMIDADTGCASAVRLAVTANIDDPGTPTGDTTQEFCAINNPTVANLTASGGTITWYTTATGGSALATGTALTDGTTYYASMTDVDCASATRLAVAVTINDAATPTGDASQSFCTADSPTVADLVTNEAGVTWYTAATGGSTIAGGTALTDGTTYYGSLTDGVSGCASSVRFAVTVAVGNAPTPTTSDATQDFCAVDNPTIADLATNESDVIWYNAATGGTAYSDTDSLTDGTTYYGGLIVGSCISATRLEVTVNIDDAATPGGATTQNFCAINNPTVANLSATGGTITWYNAATGGSVVSSGTALVDGTIYYASITDGVSGCESSVRLAVTANIDDAATPGGDTEQTFCAIDSPKVSDLVATGGTVTWYTAATGGSSIAGGTALVDGTTYYGSLTDGGSGCASSVRLAVTVTVNDASTPTGDTAQSFCAIDSPTVADLAAAGGTVTWYTAATGGSVVTGGTALVDGTTYYGSLTQNSCESSVRLAVTVTINNASAPTTADDTQEFCGYDDPTLADIQINESNITWYASSSGGSSLSAGTALVNNTTYYATYTDGVTGCESTSRLPVTVTLTTSCDIALNIKVMLQGALSGTSDGLMRDDLRTAGLIPTSQPYSNTLNARFTHVNNAGDETTNSTVLDANDGTGDAIVDWIFVEIRDAADETTILETHSVLLQRDGDIVDPATGGAFRLTSMPETFYVSVKHRNHFGAMTSGPVTASMGSVTVDFTTITDAQLYHLPASPDNVAMNNINITGYVGRALYAGNANYDTKIKYDGVNNDRQTMGSQVLSHVNNTGQVLNYEAVGYLSGDINMDGKIKYDGINNERQVMQNSVLTYPLNTSLLNNYNNMIEQIPQ